MWKQLCTYSHVLASVLNDDYFRSALYLVLDTFSKSKWCRRVEVVDVDVAIRQAGGPYDDEPLSTRERRRLDRVRFAPFHEKQQRAHMFEIMGYKVEVTKPFTPWLDYPFLVERNDSSQSVQGSTHESP